jgi:pimeloyl-ACP methyl ester carboxylesterase
VLDRLGIGAAHVYGISMGGMVAQELALRFPERVRGLVLGATSPGGPRAARPSLGEIGGLVGAVAAARRTGGGVRGRTWLADWLFSETFRREQPERVRELLRDFAAHRATARGLLSHLAASTYHDTVARLPQVQAPTLVLHGAEDAMAPVANARLLAARIPDAELQLVAGAGHAYPLERPEASAALVIDFVDRRSPIAPGRPRAGRTARLEPVTRPFGLAVGAARTGVSLVHALRNRGEDHVGAD